MLILISLLYTHDNYWQEEGGLRPYLPPKSIPRKVFSPDLGSPDFLCAPMFTVGVYLGRIGLGLAKTKTQTT
jgi:hypothetical protein